jgi:very-short-patch-repair endonuclease
MLTLPDLEVGLDSGRFFVVEAREIGLTWKALQNKRWSRLSRGQYVSSRLTRDINVTLHAVARRMRSTFAFSGKTAAWLLGLDMSPCEPIEVTLDRGVPVRARAGVRLRRATLAESEVTIRHGFRSTCALRTVRDSGSGREPVESVVAVDMAVRAGIVRLQELTEYVARHPGEKGIKRLRRAIALADPRSESPMETRLRVELIKAGLPRPDVQTELRDISGRLLGRADLYYPDSRLVIEYDGENHKDRLVSDLRRQNALVNAGYQILRFTAADLRAPDSIAAQVRHALARGRHTAR